MLVVQFASCIGYKYRVCSLIALNAMLPDGEKSVFGDIEPPRPYPLIFLGMKYAHLAWPFFGPTHRDFASPGAGSVVSVLLEHSNRRGQLTDLPC